MSGRTVIIDLWTDDNRGDAALQVSLVRIARERRPGSVLTGIYRFGFNEFPGLGDEIGISRRELDRALGGPRITHYSGAARAWQRSRVLRALANAWSLVRFVAVALLYLALGRFSRWLMSRTEHEALRAVDEADLVLWKGKNFREYGGMTTLTRAISLSLNVLPAMAMRKRVLCVNASFWEIRNRPAKLYYRLLASRCEVVVVREAESLAHVRRLAPRHPRLRQAADLSLKLMGDLRRSAGPATPLGQRPMRVALTVTEWGGDAQKALYVETVVAALARLAAEGVREAVVVPQVIRSREANTGVLTRIIDGARAAAPGLAITVPEGAMAIEDLVAAYAGCRLLLGSRMHSCVFARTAGTPFVALAYDEGSKWAILAEFWPARFIHPYSRLVPGEVAAHASELLARGEDEIRLGEPAFARLIATVAENIPTAPESAP